MRSLNLDHVRAFADVIEQGSFSAAAERLNLTQPAVSQQVRQLEQRLGVRLIDRVGRRATPTAAGSALLDHHRRIDEAVGAALDAMAEHAAETTGRVRLGSGATACTYLLPPLLRDLRLRFPALEIVVRTGNTADMLRAVEDNVLDVGFVTLPVVGRMFAVTPVLSEEFVAITSAAGPELSVRPTPAAIAGLPIVLYEPGANTRRVIDDWFMHAGLAPKPVMELGSVEAIKGLVGAGLGCSILPRMAVEGEGRRGQLTVRSLRPRLHRQLALVMRRDKPLTRALRDVVAAIRSAGRSGLGP